MSRLTSVLLAAVLGAGLAACSSQPDPAPVALDYLQAELTNDYETIYELAAPTIREGMSREEFIEVKTRRDAGDEPVDPSTITERRVLRDEGSRGGNDRRLLAALRYSEGWTGRAIVLTQVDGQWRVSDYRGGAEVRDAVDRLTATFAPLEGAS